MAKEELLEFPGMVSELLPNATFREIRGTHMSSVTKPELGEAMAEFLSA